MFRVSNGGVYIGRWDTHIQTTLTFMLNFLRYFIGGLSGRHNEDKTTTKKKIGYTS